MAALDVATSAPRTAGSGAPGVVDPLAPKNEKERDRDGDLVVDRWKQCAEELVKQRRDYWQNLAMFFGEQWVWWDNKRNMLHALGQDYSPMGRGRARTVTNRLAPNLMSLLGRMLRNELEFDVPPTDSADDVMSGAMLAEDVLNAAHHDLDWRDVRYSENFAKFIGGTSAVCVEWNPQAGVKLAVDEETSKVIGTGEVELTAMSINEFGVEPGVRDVAKANWWVQGLAFAPAAVKANYNLSWTPAADASTLMSPLQQKLLEHIGKGQGVNRLTLVLTMYEKPNPGCPAGRYLVVVNGRTVYKSKWPKGFPKTGLNVFPFRQQQVDSSWVGRTLMNDAVPIQVTYNFFRSIIAEHAKKVGNAKLMAPLGSIIEEDVTDDPGDILGYSPDIGGGKPEYLRAPDMPRWLVGEAGDLKAELDDIMFVHDTSRGQASFDRASGQALALLAEKDDSPLGLMAFEEAQRWSEIGSFVLALYEAQVSETRTVQVRPGVGQPGDVRPSRWNGKQLKGQTRCIVPLESTQPYSQAAMQAFTTDLFDRGIIKDPTTFARMLKLPGRELLSVVDADVAKAQAENSAMMLGEAPEPAMFDDHGKHIAEHNRHRKMRSYQYAAPEIRSIIDNHIKYHEMLGAEQLGQQTQKALANPAVAALPQADEPVGSMVPPDFAEQQAGLAQVGASVTAQQGAQPQPGAQPGMPMQPGQQPPAQTATPEGSPAMAAGAPAMPGGQ